MGGLLRQRGGLRHEWEQVSDDSKWSIKKMPPELNHTVCLSYEYMPSYLKQCFLFYSLLPKSRIFIMDQVVAMWISEGFINGNSSDLEELGEKYFNELVSRNLIEHTSFFGTWFCSMHDVVRSFAHYMTKDEALVAEDGDIDILSKLSSQNFLRLSVETSRSQCGELDWQSLQTQQSVRTLISTIQMKMKPGYSLVTFSSLRTLYIQSANVVALVESLHKLKHVRYLALYNTDISVLPGNIGKMKLLQFLDLAGCPKFVNLPDSIVMLGRLRLLHLPRACMVPRGLSGLTDMRRLSGFQVHMDGDWCSLDELGLLSELRTLELNHLENVSAASCAANARIGEKMHLVRLLLNCTSKLGYDGLVKEKGVSEEENQRIESVFDELCPPPSVEYLVIKGYFGRKLSSWMMFTPMIPLSNLKTLLFSDMASCTQLPNGLCQIPYLQDLQVNRAPCIRHIGTGFLQATKDPFPRLNKLELVRMVQLEEWEWEEQVQAMPRLKEFLLFDCRLRSVPPGLASNARALKKLSIQEVKHLNYLESFPSVVELKVSSNPDLERITNFPNLQKLTIIDCPKLKGLEIVPVLESMNLHDYAMEKLPEYMRHIKARHLQLFCRIWLLCSMAEGQSGLEWDKFSHVEHVRAYAPDGYNPRKWYVLYTRRDNFKLDSNISNSTVFEGFESVYKMRRSTFSYVCSLVRIPFLEDMMARDHTFVDGRVLSLQDGVAVALRMLNSGEAPVIVGTFLGVDEPTVSLITQVFVKAMWDRAMHHCSWPGPAKMEKIKHKFDKISGLLNCCGVVHTDHITFGSQNNDHEENAVVLLQAVVDPDMRFTNIWADYDLWEEYENGKGDWLNGRILKLSDGSDIGEYIIGDAGYPLRPWLLTPYQLENDLSLSDSQVEFNRRHSTATAVTLRALARLKGTWKCLQGEGWHPNNKLEMYQTIHACSVLHNLVIEMEDGGCMPSDQEDSCVQQVRQVAEEDAVKVRDALSKHLIQSGVHTMATEEEQEAVAAASAAGDEYREEEARLHRRKTDRGKEKVHDN